MRASDREILRIPRGNNFKTLKVINRIAEMEKTHPIIQQSIREGNLTGSKKDIQRVFETIYKLVKFFPDPNEIQYVRTVNRQLKERRANCVDYTVFLSAFLRALNVPHKIRMVRTEPEVSGYNHIYCVLIDGTPLDLVINQDQDGSEPTKTDREPPRFGEQVPFLNKFDKLVK